MRIPPDLAILMSLLVLASSPSPASDVPEPGACAHLVRAGLTMEAPEASQAEHRLVSDPGDPEAHVKLLVHYASRRGDEGSAEGACRHLLWLVENDARDPVLQTPYASDPRLLSPECAARVREAWLAISSRPDASAPELANAATFLARTDVDRAHDLLVRAMELEPAEPRWPSQLARLCGRARPPRGCGGPEGALELSRRALALTPEPARRQLILQEVATRAMAARDVDTAEAAALELLARAGKVGCSGGDATHQAHVTLGRVAMARGHEADAARHLVLAGQVGATPVLGSFGPDMCLARELLLAGHTQEVLSYLDACAAFWESGRERLTSWAETIRRGGEPDFGSSLRGCHHRVTRRGHPGTPS